MITGVVGRMVLAAAYFIVVTPVAVIRRVVGGNPMRHQLGEKGYWAPTRSRGADTEAMRRPS